MELAILLAMLTGPTIDFVATGLIERIFCKDQRSTIPVSRDEVERMCSPRNSGKHPLFLLWL
jgi:hypothetical protein